MKKILLSLLVSAYIIVSCVGCDEADKYTEASFDDSSLQISEQSYDLSDNGIVSAVEDTAQEPLSEDDNLPSDETDIADEIVSDIEASKEVDEQPEDTGNDSLTVNEDSQAENEIIDGQDAVISDTATDNEKTSNSEDSPASVSNQPSSDASIENASEVIADISNCDFVLNTNSDKFHYPNCSSVSKMAKHNTKYFIGTRDEAIAQGYDPCGRCKP